jgi:hypothetical protein
MHDSLLHVSVHVGVRRLRQVVGLSFELPSVSKSGNSPPKIGKLGALDGEACDELPRLEALGVAPRCRLVDHCWAQHITILLKNSSCCVTREEGWYWPTSLRAL